MKTEDMKAEIQCYNINELTGGGFFNPKSLEAVFLSHCKICGADVYTHFSPDQLRNLSAKLGNIADILEKQILEFKNEN